MIPDLPILDYDFSGMASYRPPTPEEMLAMIERAGEDDPQKWEAAVRKVAAIPPLVKFAGPPNNEPEARP